ncbi:MAG: MFS transporter [Candidatus Ancillula sp.]|nr:MFS transporter [Candidatus Ancillula sp.]
MGVAEKYSVDKNLKFFELSYVLRSTVLVMPIISLWWTEHVGLSIGQYLTLASIFPLVAMSLDLPLSFLADRIGVKYCYVFGLFAFSMAFFCAVMLKNVLGYILYLAFCTVCDALISGVDSGLLKEISGEKNYRKNLVRITRKFYLFTTPLFILGVFIYNFSPELILLLQGAIIFLAGIFAFFIKSGSRKREDQSDATQKINSCSPKMVIKPVYIAALLVVLLSLSVYNGVVQSQNRTIQILVDSQNFGGSLSPLYILAILMGIGNIMSVLGVSKNLSGFIDGLSALKVNLMFSLGFFISLLFLSSGSIILISIGYLLISIGKGMYRPYYSSCLSRLQPTHDWNARWFSIASVFSVIFAAIVNISFTSFSEDLRTLELMWGSVVICAGIISIFVFWNKSNMKIPVKHNNSFSQKCHYKIINHNPSVEPEYLQEYSRNISDLVISEIIHNVNASALPHPEYTSITKSSIVWEFIEGKTLTNCKSDIQKNVIIDLTQLLSSRPCVQSTSLQGGSESSIGKIVLELCTCMTNAHGDLHPDNILVKSDGSYVVIDWDLSGIYSRLFDEYTLLWHPFLKISLDQRFKLLEQCRNNHLENCKFRKVNLKTAVISMSAAKIRDIESWGDDDFISSLSKKYKELLESVKEYEN